MSFFYNLFLKLLYPTSLCLAFLLVSAFLWKRKAASRACFWLAVVILAVCGNGWLAGKLTKHLEWQYLPLTPVPEADCIVVLSGGVLGQIYPRPTFEIGESGNRVLYGAYLYRQGRAPRIICTGGVMSGGPVPHPGAQDMADFLKFLGVPADAIVTEMRAEDTHEHARNLCPVFTEMKLHRVLLVTSALHMPRSMGVFKRLCPDMVFIAAPTDFRVTEGPPIAWFRRLAAFFPTPKHLGDFSDVSHEYLGMAYYRMRGWM